MKRTQEKVKDIVEVRAFESLRDFHADPAKTLANYHFTDGTAELAAKWLDRIAGVQTERGAALALAGYRGVGKSHLLATLGAIVSHPELRSRVQDPHVAASAQRLLRRHYPIAYVRRGTHETLIEEFNAAISLAVGVDISTLGNSLTEILQSLSAKAGDLPFVLMIDTAFERGSRVARDDGPFLSEIAEAAKGLNIFLGVALDDDIAGADGQNSAIARSFNIDFLDHEHLYKVVNSHIFPKLPQMQAALQDIYAYFREVLPSFRWSENKFSSLYPLHPAILEVAPFVRLYVPEFALLSFASAAGERILGRPANSLIALDEVFDNAEKGLRKIEDLIEAFAAYDKLNTNVVGKLPVMQRLQAKLILKALLLLSLDGEGTTAGEISASMLIFDEAEPEKAVTIVHDLIKQFADALPEDIRITAEEGRETRYGFKVSSKDILKKALSEKITGASSDIVPRILRRLMQERFSDSAFSSETDGARKDWMDCQVGWRGGMRRGRIFWSADDSVGLSEHALTGDSMMDWEVIIDLRSDGKVHAEPVADVSRIFWKPDDIRKDEIETILRYHALSTDSSIREQFSEQYRASLHSHAVAVEKILNRIFLEDGRLVIDGFDYNCTEEARSSQTLSELFSQMLDPLFETRYPEHPRFLQRLGMNDVATLITDLYSVPKQHLAEVQSVAQAFALPLGLVRHQDGVYVPESGDQLKTLPTAAQILQHVDQNGKETTSLNSIYALLRKEPFGLGREAQHLILTALVAERQIEFVTSKGDRISRRSLDLTIIWDDIVGIAKLAGAEYSAKKLARWASLVTGNTEIKSLESKADRETLRAGFEAFLTEWKTSRVLDRFNELPDHILNTRIWGLAAHTAKTLGAAAENIQAALGDFIPFEEAVNRIADTFSDSPEHWNIANGELAVVDSFIRGASSRDEILSYVSVCEVTNNEEIEELREQLLQAVDLSYSNASDAANREMGYLWIKFQRDFADHFAEQHDAVMKSHSLQGKYDEIMSGNGWWQFQNLSAIGMFDSTYWDNASEIRRQFNQLDCTFDVRQALSERPFCICPFGLSKVAAWENLPDQLSTCIAAGIASYRRSLSENKDKVTALVETFSHETSDKEASAAASEFVALLQKDKDAVRFSTIELQFLQKLLRSTGTRITAKPTKINKNPEPVSESKENPVEWAAEIVDDAVIMTS
jgi:energy-coupling factor transporter ATP-binding protein EcfA2